MCMTVLLRLVFGTVVIIVALMYIAQYSVKILATQHLGDHVSKILFIEYF